ncbi:Fe-S-oxidoreductase [Nonlabens sp. YIK11]|uniref:YkgJ family cysteine cluster protein n=1 Tax=Nonlabens sp. YIK11 TaxID=1453349 RepID=UPI0006DCCAAC|nr:YkgJ family cysteine cluster protein [Nonlabens sp. YIK11]KQC34298.1 Fe-S-oxidoreductase [Nonlabens sp. YIK11]
MISPEDLPSLAAQRKKENVAFFKKLKRKAPKNLDSITQELHDEAFEEIDCLTCANCCKTTGPLFTQNDINRIAKHFKMKPAAFIDTYLRVDEDQDYVLQTVPCPFLGADNYCGIYEVRPKACSEYPHTDRRKLTQIASLTIANTFICPAAFQVVERMKELIKS